MRITDTIDAKTFCRMILHGGKKLEKFKDVINDLNVFPVPDGDTGTNMSLTLNSAAKYMVEKGDEASLPEMAEALSHGALMGARGNSGVIMSQLLGGFAKTLPGHEKIDSSLLIEAFENSVTAAYKAVVKPIEGTILTVAREASESVSEKMTSENNLCEIFDEYLLAGNVSLKKTPELLPDLKQSVVVDDFGKGFLVFCQGMAEVLKGEEGLVLDTVDDFPDSRFPGDGDVPMPVTGEIPARSDLTYIYCTEFMIKKSGEFFEADSFRAYLESIGDSIVAVDSDAVIKIHVHTNNPGQAMEEGLKYGELIKVKVDNMAEQVGERHEIVSAMKPLGLVAVSSGDGLNEIFRSLGVDVVISGGQTMNPSTEDILSAVKNTNSSEVIILPNNSNIILAAEQAAELSAVPIHVVKTKYITQGISALMAYNPEITADENYNKMLSAFTETASAEITRAVRDSSHNGLEISEGSFIGLYEGDIVVSGESLEEVMATLITKGVENVPDSELITLYAGEETDEEESENLLSAAAEKYSEIDFELHYGGQPLYYYYISFE